MSSATSWPHTRLRQCGGRTTGYISPTTITSGGRPPKPTSTPGSSIEDDFSEVPIAQFWPKMNDAKWVHPIDQNGRLCSFMDIPNHLEKLRDDPCRSLAGYVRNAGGYEKTATGFAEFLWADFFRPRVLIGPTRPDFHSSVDKALTLATSAAAANLPGYKGPEIDTAATKSADAVSLTQKPAA